MLGDVKPRRLKPSDKVLSLPVGMGLFSLKNIEIQMGLVIYPLTCTKI